MCPAGRCDAFELLLLPAMLMMMKLLPLSVRLSC